MIDTLPSEITGYADVVLPEVTFLERHEQLLIGTGRRGWVALRQPVMPAPHEQKPNWWIAKELAAKLGIPECLPFKNAEEYLRYRVEKSGLCWDELKRDGVILGAEQPIYVEDGAPLAFDTPSGKVEFWSDQLQAKGFDPVLRYTPPAPPPEGFFPLVTGRAPGRIGNAHPNIVPYQTFACADGHIILAVGNDGQFARFSEAAGRALPSSARSTRSR